jgi:hypothetical protein
MNALRLMPSVSQWQRLHRKSIVQRISTAMYSTMTNHIDSTSKLFVDEISIDIVYSCLLLIWSISTRYDRILSYVKTTANDESSLVLFVSVNDRSIDGILSGRLANLLLSSDMSGNVKHDSSDNYDLESTEQSTSKSIVCHRSRCVRFPRILVDEMSCQTNVSCNRQSKTITNDAASSAFHIDEYLFDGNACLFSNMFMTIKNNRSSKNRHLPIVCVITIREKISCR